GKRHCTPQPDTQQQGKCSDDRSWMTRPRCHNGKVILGIGTDMTEIDRIRDSIARFGDRFLHRIFTPGEIAYCLRKKASEESFAARFAAKEAAAKALGTGISRGISWQEIEVRRQPGER